MKNINLYSFMINGNPDLINEFTDLNNEFLKNTMKDKYKNAKEYFVSKIENWDDKKTYIAYLFYKKSGNSVLSKILLESSNKKFKDKLNTIDELEVINQD